MSFVYSGSERTSILEQMGVGAGAEQFVWSQLCNNMDETSAGFVSIQEAKSGIEQCLIALKARSYSAELAEKYRVFRNANKPNFYSKQSIDLRQIKRLELESALKIFHTRLRSKQTDKDEKVRTIQQVALLNKELIDLNNPDFETARWNQEYPESHLLVVRNTLQRVLEETKDISFNAPFRNGQKRKFSCVAQDLESKPESWKTAMLLGQEASLHLRSKAVEWIREIDSIQYLN